MIDYAITIMGTKPGTKKAQITETKAYGTAQCREIFDLDKFVEHVSDHNCPFSAGTIKGVLEDATGCLRELLLGGNKVNLGALGGFYVELATEGAVTAEEFSAERIKAVNVRWVPGKSFKNLRQVASFNLVPTREAQMNATKEIKNQETIHGME